MMAGQSEAGTAAGLCWHNYRRVFCQDVFGLAAHTAFVPWSVPSVAAHGAGVTAKLIALYATCTALTAAIATPVPGAVVVACFADGTDVMVKRGTSFVTVPVESVTMGQDVLTLEEGRATWTTVASNTRWEGNDTFIQIQATHERITYSLTVTEGHIMPRATQHRTFESFAVVLASDLRLGDMVSIFDGFVEQIATVVALSTVRYSHRNTLSTTSGTVIANSLLTTTVCDSFAVEWQAPNMSAMLSLWKAEHSALLVV